MKRTIRYPSNIKPVLLVLLMGLLNFYPGFLAATEEAQAAVPIAQLMKQAQQALAADHLTLPPEDNAVAYAQKILERHPEHPGARQILKKVVARYVELGESVLEQAGAENRQALQQAEAYARRAEEVVKRYQLPEATLEPLVSRLAAAKVMQAVPPPEPPVVRQLLGEIVDRYVQLGEDALARGEIEAARQHQQEAQHIVSKYDLPDREVLALAENIQAKESLAAERRRQQVLSSPEAQELLKEVVTSHVELGEAALSEGAVQQARWHHQRAQAIATEYQLPDEEIKRLSQHLARYEEEYRRFWIFGTF